MAYRLEHGEPLARGLQRCLLEELDRAAADLDGLTADLSDERVDEVVHEVRKSLKRSRTVLRLLRGAIGDTRYRSANERLRSAGRALSATRDAAVLAGTLRSLVGEAEAERFRGLADALDRELAATRRLGSGEAGPGPEALERILAGRADAACWDLAGDLDAGVLAGLQRVYRRGRKRQRAAREEPTAAALHAWRKRVKDLGYAVGLIAPAWPETLDPLAEELGRLWGLLGDDHDLAVLTAAADERGATLKAAAERAELERRITDRRAECQAAAFALGERIYAERPRAFAGRVEVYLGAWHAPSTGARSDD